MNTLRIKVWDLPVRIFHWLLASLVIAAIVTGKIGGNAIVWHGRIGLAILGLIVFRIMWGLLGSTHARFSSFLPTPSSIKAYLAGQWDGHGHNPLGAISVFGLLALTAAQVSTGLFANDDIAFRGPLYELIGKGLSDTLTGYHMLIVNGLIALIVLHLCAIVFHVHVKKDNLIGPMISGWKTVYTSRRRAHPRHGGGMIAFCFSVIVALTAVSAGAGLWLPDTPETPAPAANHAPGW